MHPESKKSMRNLTNAELAQILDKDIFHKISEAADGLSVECYVVGGYVRDLFLERPSNDIDVVVVGSGIEVASALKKMLGRKAHLSVFRNFGTAQVKYQDTEVEFVGARKESYQRDSRKPIVEDGTLEDDQNRRDFTINARAICLNKDRFGELVDPFDGVYDMEDGIIATPLDPDITFSDDPLRMMRCVRFATQLNFQIEEETYDALSRNAERLKIISAERICDEMNKIMLSKHPSCGFYYLKDTGLLDLILPELVAMDKVETRNGRAHKNNYDHTMEVLENVCKHSDNLWLRWAALFHDIGKIVTDEEGSHVELGVKLLQKYNMPKPVVDAVAQHHEDTEFTSKESILVYIADAISGARPGARYENIEEYANRLRSIEDIAMSKPGVYEAYAISAGREVRVMVDPGKATDDEAIRLASDIRDEIKAKVTYPGTVTVTVIRELRSQQVAK